jgi:hypothetical protein
LAKGQWLRAKGFLLSKIVQLTTFSPWSEFPTLPFCSPFCQGKTAADFKKIVRAHRVEQAFMPAVKKQREAPSSRRRPARSKAERAKKSAAKRSTLGGRTALQGREKI